MYSLSMVVPAFNEEELLEEFIHKSVRDMSAVSDDFEIILVDDARRTHPESPRTGGYPQLTSSSCRNLGNGANVMASDTHQSRLQQHGRRLLQ